MKIKYIRRSKRIPAFFAALFLCSNLGVGVTAWGEEPSLANPIPDLPPLRQPVVPSTVETAPETNQPVLEQSPLPELGDLFLLGEGFYHGGDFEQARLYYNDFLKNHSEDARVPQALLRMANMDFNQGAFASALRLTDFLLHNHAKSKTSWPALSLKGRCLFELGRMPEAESIFRNVLRANPGGKRRWEALSYLGKISAMQSDPNQALKRLLSIMESDAGEEMKTEAASLIRDLIFHGFDKAQLMTLLSSYSGRYPGDLALIRLIKLYRSERDTASYQVALKEFVSRFPGHAKTQGFQAQLETFKNDTREVVKLGAVLPLSGERALVGQKVLQGIQLAFNQLSMAEKEKLELVVRDSGLGRKADEVVRELAEDPDVIGLMGPVLSEEVRQSAPVLEQYELAAFTPTASSPGLMQVSPNVFRNALTREIQAQFLAQYAINELGLYRFVILYPEETFGQNLMELFSKHVESLGGTIVESLPYDRSQNDFKKQILKIGGIPDDKLKKQVLRDLKNGTQSKPLDDQGTFSRPVVEGGVFEEDDVEGLKVSLELNYDAIFIPGLYDKVGLIAPQLAFYNIEKVRLLGTNGWNSRKLVDSARKYLSSAVFVDGFFSKSREPNVQKFHSQFVATFGEEPSSLSAQAYDCASILIKLIRENARNRLDILKNLPKVKDFPGVAGQTTLLPSGESEKQLAKLGVKGFRIIEK